MSCLEEKLARFGQVDLPTDNANGSGRYSGEEEDLFPELEDLCKDPSKFLKSSGGEEYEYSVCDDDADSFESEPSQDVDLVNYFAGRVKEETKAVKNTKSSGSKDSKRRSNKNMISEDGQFELQIIDADEFIKKDTLSLDVSQSKFMQVMKPLKVQPERSQGSPTLGSNDLNQPPICMSKTAVAARENRQKKKHYISGLETSVCSLSEENKSLKKDLSEMQQTIKSLSTEVQYLSSVISNQSTLSALLKNICATPGVNFAFSGESGQDVLEENNVEEASTPSDKRQSKKRAHGSDQITDECVKENINFNKSLIAVGSDVRAKKLQKLVDHDYASGKRSTDVPVGQTKNSKSVFKPDRTSTNSQKSHSDGGVCLHVSNNMVSLEFCSKCSSRPSQAKQR